MDTEEVNIKMGFNTDELQNGIQRGSRSINQWLHDTGLGFVHAESAGKTFKKLLHEISDASPLLGAAIRSALAPEVVVMQALTKVFSDYEKQQEEAIKKSEEHAKRETARYLETFEVANKASEAVRKGREEQEKFESSIGRQKPAEIEKERHAENIEKARRESSTDSEFQEKKRLLDINEQYVVAAKEEHALEREKGTAALVNDEERIRSIEELKNKIKAITEMQKEGAMLAFGGGKEKSEWLGLLSKEEHNSLTQAIGTDRANLMADLRQKAEEELRIKETALAKDKELMAEAKSDVTDFHKLKKDLLTAEKEDEKKKFDALKKEQEEAEKLAEKERKKAIDQQHFDREIAQSKKHRAEAERQPYLPTLQELANSMPWKTDFGFESQKESDRFRRGAGMAYGQKFAEMAQEKIRLEDETRRALFMEGPESTRFKEDIKKMDSLKKGLAAAGLQTSDDRLQSIDDHMRDLLDRASKEGLVVQPVNGP